MQLMVSTKSDYGYESEDKNRIKMLMVFGVGKGSNVFNGFGSLSVAELSLFRFRWKRRGERVVES